MLHALKLATAQCGFNPTKGDPVYRRAITWAGAIGGTVLILAGCTGSTGEPGGTSAAPVSGYAGIVAADEPRAATVGREVLAGNGTAVDAAVAMGFAMTATLPSRVGLGGGGACVVHKRRGKVQDSVVFLPSKVGEGAAAPGLARGMAALHARYGVSQWAGLVRPAERLAAFGHDISRAFRKDLAAGEEKLGQAARSIYLRDDGSLPAVGDRITQPALGSALAGLRQRGAGYMTTGSFARTLSEGAKDVGQPLSVADIRDTVPAFETPISVAFGPHSLLLPPAPVSAGVRTAAAWRGLSGAELGAPSSAEWWRALIGASRETGRATTAGATKAGPSAGLAVADRFGNLVACGFTLNGLFGTGRIAAGTGVFLAEPQPEAVAGAAILPAIVSNRNTGIGYLAAHAGPDSAAPAALTQTLALLHGQGGVETQAARIAKGVQQTGPLRVSTAQEPRAAAGASSAEARGLGSLLGPARAAAVPGTRVVRHEPGLADAVRRMLVDEGYGLDERPGLGRVLLVHCPGGAASDPVGCSAAVDPRGHGMAVRAQ